MIALVTGAAGFIGSHLTEALLRRGHTARALAHYNSRGSWGHLDEIDHDLRGKLDVRLGDITDPYLMRDLVAGCDIVFHLAALIGIPYSYHAPASYVATNINGTLNILEACRQADVRRTMITSTSEVYGTARYTPIDESHPLQGQSPYSASKIAADKLAESFFCSFGLPVTVVRPFNTYGPRQSARAVIPTIAAQIAAGMPEIRLGSLWPERDLTFVEDTAGGFIALAECDEAIGQVVNLGTGQKISIGALAERMVELSGKDLPVRSTEERARPVNSEVGVLVADTTKARRLTGWEARISLDDGLRRTMECVAANLERYRPETYQR
jgi:NAD dependent epimerase/dehydratase